MKIDVECPVQCNEVEYLHGSMSSLMKFNVKSNVKIYKNKKNMSTWDTKEKKNQRVKIET